VQVDPIKPDSKPRAWCRRLKLGCDEPLSDFDFNLDLRRYTMAEEAFDVPDDGPVHLDPIKAESKLRLVPALETRI